MKAITKTALITASILSMGALSACQSTSAPNERSGSPMMGHHKAEMTPEQREQFKEMRQERKEFKKQASSACDRKSVNQAVQIKVGEQTIDGTCHMVFKADRKAMKEMKHDFRENRDHRMQGEHRGAPRMKDMTEQQRAQRKQDFEQKRMERKAQWEAIQKSCVGQPNGQNIQVKMGEKLIPGKCEVKFKPNQPLRNMRPMPPVVNAATL